MKSYTITVNGNVYDVTVEEGAGVASAPVAAAPKAAPKPAPKPRPALSSPTLSSDQLNQNTKTERIKLTVGNVPDGAELYYSVDGSEPSILSKNGSVITVNPHFKSDKNPEPDKQITIKLRYEYNGSRSSIGTYQINVHKDYKSYICI